MKVLINLPKEALENLETLAKKKKWSRKKYMETVLISNSLKVLKTFNNP